MRRLPLILLMLSIASAAFSAELFRFKADRMLGGRATGREKTVLSGHAEVISDDLTLRADYIELSGTDMRTVECSGNVTGQDDKKGIRFTTKKLRYDRVLKLARLEGDSSMDDRKNSVTAKGRFIEYNDMAGTILLQVGVRIFKDKMVCRSDYALYRREEKTLELSGLPVVFKDGDEFRSDRMKVNLDTDEIAMEGAVSGSLSGIGADKKKADETAPATAAPEGLAPSASDPKTPDASDTAPLPGATPPAAADTSKETIPHADS